MTREVTLDTQTWHHRLFQRWPMEREGAPRFLMRIGDAQDKGCAFTWPASRPNGCWRPWHQFRARGRRERAALTPFGSLPG